MQYRRLVILLLLVAILVAMSALDPVHAALSRVLESAKQIIRHHEILGLLLFVVLSAVSAILFFFSSAVIVPVAVYSWGKTVTVLLLWIGWLGGAAISYEIGRHPGRRLAQWLVSSRRVEKYDKKISANVTFPFVLLFQFAVPSEIPGYVLGALRYRFIKYLAACAIVEIPFAVGAVYLGETFMRRQYVPLIVIAIAGVILSTVAFHFLHKRIDQ
jgi:uncharacterized membrane protein YdjX (TVP38/TMEM64 family)